MGKRLGSFNYGDQEAQVFKPHFRDPQKVLNAAIRKLIVKHDRASVEADTTKDYVAVAIKTLTPTDSNKWGSEQLEN